MGDPLQQAKVIYPLEEILLLSLLAVVAGAKTFTGIAEFGKTSSICCGACDPSNTERPVMTGWASCSPQRLGSQPM
ncbi:transposase family protein [Pelagibacterium halotolerans]|uniref:transposase family protein n=1 Tax=Pelagibacterium halotolerans TaxID=531813 RepID=UPI00384AC09D